MELETISSQIRFCAVSCRGRLRLALDLLAWMPVLTLTGKAGVAGASDAVLAAGPLAVTQFEVGELAAFGVGGEAGEPQSVEVGETQPGAGVRPASTT